MKKVLIVRHGAYGDVIHCSHLPRMLKDAGWDFVGFSTGFKGYQLLRFNPFIDIFHFFEHGGRKISEEYFDNRLKIISQEYDKVIDLNCSLEENCLAMERQNEYYQHISVRKKMGERNYYDVSTEIAGYPDLCGQYRGEVFYTKKETELVENDLLREGRFKDKFKVMINVSGTGPHKFFVQSNEVIDMILAEYPDAVIFLTGGMDLTELEVKKDRVHSIIGKKPFRQALLMAKYMDCMIGCESGIMVGASMWDVPTIQLLTATSHYCHCKYSTKDYSLQSPAECSPCYKGPYKYYGCPKINDSPKCVYFSVDKILEQVKKAYDNHFRTEHLLPETSVPAVSEVSAVR